jgi:hypothetical protein
VSLVVSDRPPRIDRISPEIGVPGGILVVEGANFGSTRDRSSVSIGGVRPTTSSYLEWTPTRISIDIPDEVTSGLVRVIKPDASSNGLLFTNRNLIPVVLVEKAVPGYPYIEGIDPSKGSVGALITITGLNFGLSRGESDVQFTALPSRADPEAAQLFTAASELDFDYESWSDQTVRVRVPDGATSGTLRIVTDRGMSNSQFFEVLRNGGSKSLGRKKGYQISLRVDVERITATSDGVLEFWIPGPIPAVNQRNVESVKEPTPFRDEYRGISRYQLTRIDPELKYSFAVTFWLDRYENQTNITPTQVITGYATQRKLYGEYTSADEDIPAADESIAFAASSAAGNQTNPYIIARNVFYFLLTQMAYDRKSSAKTVTDAFIAARGNAEDYSLLYCALLRSLGIPARPVTGILVYDTRRTIRHMWAEFYLEGFGWVPVDPVLADGVQFGVLPGLDQPEEYYFGNVDERRVIFSRGGVTNFPIETVLLDTATVTRIETVPSLQAFHELKSPDVETYRAVWSNVEIIDFW